MLRSQHGIYVSVNKREAFEKCWAHSPFASRRTPPVLHCHSPGVATVARCHCCTPPACRCPQQYRRQRQQRQRVTEGIAMAPWNGPNDWDNHYFDLRQWPYCCIHSADQCVLVKKLKNSKSTCISNLLRSLLVTALRPSSTETDQCVRQTHQATSRHPLHDALTSHKLTDLAPNSVPRHSRQRG